MLGAVLLALAFSAIVFEPSPSVPAILLIGGCGLWALVGGLSNLRARDTEGPSSTGRFASFAVPLAWLVIITLIITAVSLAIWMPLGNEGPELIGLLGGAILFLSAIAGIVGILVYAVFSAISRARRTKRDVS